MAHNPYSDRRWGGGTRLTLDRGERVAQARLNWLRGIAVLAVLVLIGRLVWVQLIIGPNLSAQAEEQRRVTITIPAKRGSITDTNGTTLAYTMQTATLSVHPSQLRDFMQQRHEIRPEDYPEPDQRMRDIAQRLPAIVKGEEKIDDGQHLYSSATVLTSEEILAALQSNDSYAVLARAVDPDTANAISKEFPEITVERQDVRQYPNGAIGENILGKISQDGSGQFGIELSQDNRLQGANGSYVVDTAVDGIAIPGSRREDNSAIDGDSYELTIDNEMQTYIQQALEQAATNSEAEDASAVVLDAKTGAILSMATTGTIDPNGDIDAQLDQGKEFGNRTISDPFEPGSVAKVITAAASIQEGTTNPTEVIKVPGSINMSGVTVRDAWSHGDVNFTTTGIFAKSSNVGTLILAQRLGEDTFASYLDKFGIGQATGVELPDETSGYLPARDQWGGGTLANLPIGQGFSMSLLQMASVYQTIANDGVRIQPRIVKKITDSSGNEVPLDEPQKTQVVTAETAKTVRDMFRAVTQKDPSGVQSGTGSTAAITGYQVSGKTGTAQQIDPTTKAYSNSMYWITFAGIAPADNPRFVVALMLNKPKRGVHGEGGLSAAPLFHDIASWILNHENIPVSSEEAPLQTLQE